MGTCTLPTGRDLSRDCASPRPLPPKRFLQEKGLFMVHSKYNIFGAPMRETASVVCPGDMSIILEKF